MSTLTLSPEIPRVPGARVPESVPGAESVNTELDGKRAIIVEDEGITQFQLKRILRSTGVIVVDVASNGREAVDLVLRHRPDFVLMDIQMPIMDGLEAAALILAEFRVCILILTAFSEEEYVQRARAIGACGYILKPVTSGTLIPKIADALREFTSGAN